MRAQRPFWGDFGRRSADRPDDDSPVRALGFTPSDMVAAREYARFRRVHGERVEVGTPGPVPVIYEQCGLCGWREAPSAEQDSSPVVWEMAAVALWRAVYEHAEKHRRAEGTR